MGSFGERLRRERELRGITIEEIAEATKIGSRSLRALEEEKFDRLPGGIFNKGFVRAYSRYLGIDQEQAVSDYMNAEAAFRSAPSGGGEAAEAAQAPASSAMPMAPALIALIVIALIALGGWWYWSSRRSSGPAADQRPAKGKEAPSTAPALVPTPSPAGVPGNASAPNATPDRSKAPPTAPAQAAVPVAPAPAAGQQRGGGAELNPPVDGFVVRVRAKEDSWVGATADGKSVLSEVLRTPGERSVRARDRVVLKLGNAGGVEVSYNGKLLEIAAAPSQVKTLVFTAQGLQRNASE